MQFSNANRATAVTPTDTVGTLFSVCEALWIGVGGTITFVPFDQANPGATATVSTTVPAGLFPVKTNRVAATGTAATGILALY